MTLHTQTARQNMEIKFKFKAVKKNQNIDDRWCKEQNIKKKLREIYIYKKRDFQKFSTKKKII